jgi:hypothetical protein
MSVNGVVDEGIQTEFLKYGILSFDLYFGDLFSHVVSCFFEAWSHHIIHPIFKSGDSLYPNNYRTIMFLHNSANLYIVVLHLWLFDEIEGRFLRARGQVGFGLGY